MTNYLEAARCGMIKAAKTDLINYDAEIVTTKDRLDQLVKERDGIAARLSVLEASAVVVKAPAV